MRARLFRISACWAKAALLRRRRKMTAGRKRRDMGPGTWMQLVTV
jgi:hypothetical protein